MANYDIPAYPISRLRYFRNQFLDETDFITEASYQVARENVALRALCIAGVCEGMSVTYPAANKAPVVSLGTAIDNKGRVIIIAAPTESTIDPIGLPDGDHFIHISFREKEDLQATGGQGTSDYTRWTQAPDIATTPKTGAVPDGAVVLGICTVLAGAFVGTVSTVGRQYSGIRLPAAGDSGAALTTTGAVDQTQLNASLTIRRDAAAAPGPTLTLFNAAGGANAATSIDFATYDPVGSDPSSRIRAIDDGHFSNALVISMKAPGANVNRLVERMRVTSDGAAITGNLSVYGNEMVAGNVTIGGLVGVTGAGSFGGGLTVGGLLSVTSSGVVGGNLAVGGIMTVSGASIRNGSNRSLLQTNANDWLRVNPDSQFPATALYNPVAIGTGGLAVGTWEQLPAGQLHVTQSATIGADLVVGNNATLEGNGLYGSAGWRLLETNRADWLRINPDQVYPAIALHKPVAIGTGGLSVGDWSQLPTGQLKVTSIATIAGGGRLGNIGIGGGNFFGAVTYPYETVQMDPGNNFRLWFGTTQRLLVENNGQVTIKLANGFWVFQVDGNLVKYNNAGVALWALNKVNGNSGW